MDTQMIIPIVTADTPAEAQTIPIVVCRTNTSPLSYAAIRDRNLLHDLQPFAKHHALNLHETFLTANLLHYLLFYQKTSRLRVAATTRVQNAIKTLEIAWSVDV